MHFSSLMLRAYFDSPYLNRLSMTELSSVVNASPFQKPNVDGDSTYLKFIDLTSFLENVLPLINVNAESLEHSFYSMMVMLASGSSNSILLVSAAA